MDKFIMTVVVILLVYLCVYAIVNHICKCIEHHTEHMYHSFTDPWYTGQTIGETLKMLPPEFADAEIKETRWFFDTFVIELI